MPITVVGSVAFDALQTPFGKVEKCLGGSATYFSVAASFFTEVDLVAVVGDDFSDDDAAIFRGRNINTDGLQRVDGEKTFFWSGEYGFDLNVAKTRETQLNVFANFRPALNERQRNADVLFLANIQPDLQHEVLHQCRRPRVVALDTMNLWIATAKSSLTRILREVDLVIINEAEVRQFTEEANLVRGARQILTLGPQTLVIKRGEYGVLMVTRDAIFAAPAYPLESVFDPTGAGDTFAGGFLGYLASRSHIHEREMRRAIIFGSVLASFTVEKFSLDRLREISLNDIHERYQAFRALTHFDDFEPV
ncbi:MAG TPA: PfkB family carbohydrate kinase [Thermoanaerobaculia bacterium]|jgi:sugar/nucleoside kinase (ribokinase family)|nr:PfkB family carbohydrate kinase [Thermoanaerobaculia bacterium]